TRCLSDWSSDVCSSDLTHVKTRCGGPWRAVPPNDEAPGIHPGYPISVTGDGSYVYIGTVPPGNLDPTSPYSGGRLYSVQIETREIGRASCRERGGFTEV